MLALKAYDDEEATTQKAKIARTAEVQSAKRNVERASQQASKALAQVKKTVGALERQRVALQQHQNQLEKDEAFLQKCTMDHVKASQILTRLLDECQSNK